MLLFHSKMASALEPLVSGCILRSLVVVFVSHGSGTFLAAALHEVPVSSGGSRMEVKEIYLYVLLGRALPELPLLGHQNRTSYMAFLENRER